MASKAVPQTKLTEVGRISEDWQVKQLKDLCTDISYGYTASADEEPIGPKFLRITDIVPYFIDWQTVPFCKIKNSDKEKYALKKGDIVIARTGANTGANATIKLEKDAVFASYLIRFRIDPKEADPFFVGYVLKSSLWQNFVTSILGGSAQPGANAKQLGFFRLPVPSLKEQSIIAHVLSTLDDKIEFNQQMNRTLEAVGGAVFKRWFVDFEFPNEEGKPYKSSGGQMVNSELGEIPENWEIACIGDVLELSYGKPLKETDRQAGNVPVYGSNGQIGWHDERLVKGPGIIVGRKGNPGTVIWSETDFFPIDTTFYVVPKDITKSLYYLFYALISQGLPLLSADSAVPGLNRNIAYMNSILIPSPAALSQFDEIIGELFLKIQNNSAQIATLSQIRDLLLPKLMSGGIRVPVIEENVEDA